MSLADFEDAPALSDADICRSRQLGNPLVNG
jgi:hypothetical protein